MFNIFSKSTKNVEKKNNVVSDATNSGKERKKSVIKKPNNVLRQINTKTNASKKLDNTIRQLGIAKKKRTTRLTKEKQVLIEKALATHKSQSKILEDLDNETKQRLKALALELMILRKKNKSSKSE